MATSDEVRKMERERERQKTAPTVAPLHCYVKWLAVLLFYLQILSLIIKPPIFCMCPTPAPLPMKSIKKLLSSSSGSIPHLISPPHTYTHARAPTQTLQLCRPSADLLPDFKLEYKILFFPP